MNQYFDVRSIFIRSSTVYSTFLIFFVHFKMKRGKTSAMFMALNQFILLPYHLVSFWQYIRCNISRQGNITVSNDPLISNRIYLVLLFFITTMWIWTNANLKCAFDSISLYDNQIISLFVSNYFSLEYAKSFMDNNRMKCV